jgi:hypothetical protein
VASFAVAGNFTGVRQAVALGALRDLAVDVVTGGTVKGGMFAFVIPELLNLQPVAVKTGVFAGKGDIQRRVGVLMTVDAAGNFEMGLPRLQMTLAALRDRLRHFRRMTIVAADTRNAPVFPPGRRYFIHASGVALHAFFFFIPGLCLCRRSA